MLVSIVCLTHLIICFSLTSNGLSLINKAYITKCPSYSWFADRTQSLKLGHFILSLLTLKI